MSRPKGDGLGAEIIILLYDGPVDIRKMNSRVLLLCLFSLCVFVRAAQAASAAPIIVASDEWCPYNCGEDDPREGYAVDILREIFEPAGIAVDYRVMGWERAVEEARRGHATAVIGATADEVEGFVLPEETIGEDFFAFFVKKGDPWRYLGPESLLGKSLGIPAGYSLIPEIEAFGKSHEKEIDLYRAGREMPARHNLELLVEGRLDIVADDAQVVCYLAHVMGIAEIVEYAGYDGDHADLYIAFSPSDPRSARLAVLFDKGMKNLRETGRLQSILDRYGLTDWADCEHPAH
jgi:polar amino acid transport system substrate-binding protein